jgi:hypothetical protein
MHKLGSSKRCPLTKHEKKNGGENGRKRETRDQASRPYLVNLKEMVKGQNET